MATFRLRDTSEVKGKKCIIAGLFSAKEENIENFFSEAVKIILENGGEVVGRVIQRRGVSRANKPGGSKSMDSPMSAATFMGRGKADELKDLVNAEGAELVVFLNKLSGTQKRNLSELIRCNIVDNANF